MSAATRSEIRPVVGHVLDLNGDWHLHASSAGDEASGKLSKWQDLPAQGVVRVKSPSADDYITIVDQRLRPLIERACRVVSRCAQPIYLPKSADAPSGTDAFASALRQVWSLLAGGDYERSMHRVRGAGRFSEGIAPLRDGRLDLGEAMRGVGRGRYSLSVCEQEASCEPEGNRDARQTVAFDWNPEATKIVTLGDRRPGLYEVSSAAGAPGPRVSVRILVCAWQSYPAARAAFRETQASAEKWGNAAADETTHAFLRAYLAQLARAGVCASQ